MPPKAGIRKYVAKAFKVPWNMLAFFGGMVAAVLSPWPDAMIPLVMAAELTYLGGLVSFPRFRDSVDAAEAKALRGQDADPGQVPTSTLNEMLGSLPPEARLRFHKLRLRCLEMQKLASGVRGNSMNAVGSGDDLRRDSLDRLLWIFLRLLVTQESLRRFLRSTSETMLTEKVADLGAQLKKAEADADGRLINSLRDSVALANLRLDNYKKADKNAQFVLVELDRIESKIQTLTEMTVNRQDPDLLTSQVDQAAQSMNDTETAIKDLQTITGMADQLIDPPAILDADLGGIVKNEA